MFDFSNKYNRNNFCEFLQNFLPDDYILINKNLKLEKNFQNFDEAILLYEIKSLNDLKVIEVKHNIFEKKRVKISKDLFRLLSHFSYSNALIITHSDNELEYRFSLITSKLEWISDKQIKKEFSHPKRLSFLLGPKAKKHTPTNQLLKLGKVKDFDDLKHRFNVEIVNNEFFDHYKKLYLNLKDYLAEDKIFTNFANKINLEISLFAKKLLGQIVFCYFLQKKGWLGTGKNKQFGNGDQNFLRNQFEYYERLGENFYNEFLEYFFYEGLNKENENDYLGIIKCKVPYIGGGLYEYYEGYDWKTEKLQLPNKMFSNQNGNGILDIFDLYNFTVDENEDLDVDISIDPEMLGRVFENLLEENIKKQAGTFYTPRIIVKYMSEESIINYLFNNLKDKYKISDLEKFVKSGYINFLDNNDYAAAEEVDTLLSHVKICDPAIGSGAFAVSTMNVIVKLRSYLKEKTNKKYKNTKYYFKKKFIESSIYGVDIDEFAVEISRLRLWLSLIVEVDNYNRTEPLPNLDFKIIQGNSLIETFKGLNLGSILFSSQNKNTLENTSLKLELEKKINKLADLQHNFLLSVSYTKKQKIKKDIEASMISIIQHIFKNNFFENKNIKIDLTEIQKKFSLKNKRNFFPWGIFFADIFFKNKGFDIVIANPPYINVKEIGKFDWKNELEKNFNFLDDLYSHFTFLATYIVKDEGIISFITSDTFMTLQTKKNMRELLFKYSLLKFVTTPKAFSAMVDTAIFFMQKKKSDPNHQINFLDLRNKMIDNNNIPKVKLTWEKALKPIFEGINFKSGLYVPLNDYIDNLNSVIFTPTIANIEIKEKIINKIKLQYENCKHLIKSSRDILKNHKEISHIVSKTNEGDITLLGLLTEGGQGLATGNNGDFVGCLEQTHEGNNVLLNRPKKLFELIKKNKFLSDDFKKLSKFSNLDEVKNYLNKLNEIEIRDLFKKIKSQLGRDIFGQGFIYKVISKTEIADENNLSDQEKINGIKNNTKIYVKYDKGDKQGNRWYIESPYYIKWDIDTVKWLKSNSGKPGRGMPVVRNPKFYFKKGFCWSDVHTTYLKSRLNNKGPYDVISMTLFSLTSKAPDNYLISLINSKFISEFQQEFLNNTAHFQINDARKIPIIIPKQEDLNLINQIFNDFMNLKKRETIEKNSFEKDSLILQEKLDNIVYNLYGI